MRINAFVAQSTKMSRRTADEAITNRRVKINGQAASLGSVVTETDKVTLDGNLIESRRFNQTIMLNKPVGYICSRKGQGAKTVYDLLPPNLHHLKPVGRLDKDSSGLLLMTDDGQLAHRLTHPSFEKAKIYVVKLDKPLEPSHLQQITQNGVKLDDGLSNLQLVPLEDGRAWKVTMTEGRNRQIRRTFEALGYEVRGLHRTHFGPYQLGSMQAGQHQVAK